MGNRKTKFSQVLTNNNSRFIIKTIEQKKQENKNNRTKKENKIMVNTIQFNATRFNTKDDNNLLELTDNTIILCANINIMISLADEILNTINGKAEYNDYWCDKSDIGKATAPIRFGLLTLINVNNQKITLSIEPSIIYKAKSIDDIWFIDYIDKDLTYKESIYPMTIFKGSKDVWDSGLDEVYKMVIGCRYGCYDGKWVKNDTESK